MGRVIVRRPQLFLFDEPLSNLDTALRVQMRGELARLHRQLGVTMIYVTHDQVEAMTLATRVAVFNQGILQQLGPPLELYHRPANTFVATFLGSPSMNLIDLVPVPGGLRLGDTTVVLTDAELPPGLRTKGPVRLGIRPRDLRLVSGAGHALTVDDTFRVGRERFFTFRIGHAILQGTDHRSGPGPGSIMFALEGMNFFDAVTGQRIAERAAA